MIVIYLTEKEKVSQQLLHFYSSTSLKLMTNYKMAYITKLSSMYGFLFKREKAGRSYDEMVEGGEVNSTAGFIQLFP